MYNFCYFVIFCIVNLDCVCVVTVAVVCMFACSPANLGSSAQQHTGPLPGQILSEWERAGGAALPLLLSLLHISLLCTNHSALRNVCVLHCGGEHK